MKYCFAAQHHTATPRHTFRNLQLSLLARHAECHPDDKVCWINSHSENNLKIDQEQTRYEIISHGMAWLETKLENTHWLSRKHRLHNYSIYISKHACTLCMWLCMKWHDAWLYGVHRTRRDGSSFMWHQSCQRCKYTTSVDIQKRAIKS